MKTQQDHCHHNQQVLSNTNFNRQKQFNQLRQEKSKFKDGFEKMIKDGISLFKHIIFLNNY